MLSKNISNEKTSKVRNDFMQNGYGLTRDEPSRDVSENIPFGLCQIKGRSLQVV